MGGQNYRLIAKRDIATTRPVLERAGWKCERCAESMDIRVVDQRGKLTVLCNRCRLRFGWDPALALSWKPEPSKKSPPEEVVLPSTQVPSEKSPPEEVAAPSTQVPSEKSQEAADAEHSQVPGADS